MGSHRELKGLFEFPFSRRSTRSAYVICFDIRFPVAPVAGEFVFQPRFESRVSHFLFRKLVKHGCFMYTLRSIRFTMSSHETMISEELWRRLHIKDSAVFCITSATFGKM